MEAAAETDESGANLTLRRPARATLHGTLKDSVKSKTSQFYSISEKPTVYFLLYLVYILLCLLSTLSSHCHRHILSLYWLSLCCGHAVRAYSTSFSTTGFFFLRRASLPFFLRSRPHSSSRPLGMQTRCS